MYSLSLQELLSNGKYRNIINCHCIHTDYDIRSQIKLTLGEIIKEVENKYMTELCFLNSQDIIKI